MRSVIASIDLIQKSHKILSAFTDPEHLKGWWGVERSLIELKTGGIYHLAWQVSNNGFRFVSTSKIKQYDPNTCLLLTDCCYFNAERTILGPMELSFTIEEHSDFNRLTVEQSGYQEGVDWDWYYEAVKHAWPKALNSLKEYLNTLDT
jgi:uncharacterized protein YndB with AHSA1/START domain